MHALDDLAYKLLNLCNETLDDKCPDEIKDRLSGYKEEDIDRAWSELLKIKQEGLLFSEDEYEGIQASLPESAPVKALCLNVAHDCNLRCAYCFAATGDFGTGRKLMPFETAKKAIDFVISASGKRRNIEVDFFGGEPLMAFDTVKKTVAYAREIENIHNKRFRFTITTNGMLLNEEITQFINLNMDNVVLSLDGRPQVNDLMRKTPNGKGSYSHIVPKFLSLVSNRSGDYFVRGTFTRHNLDFSQDVLHLADLGFKHLSIEPAVGKEDGGFSIREADIPAVFEEYERLSQIMIDRRDFDFFHFNLDLEQGPCVYKRLRGCGAGFEYLAVTPEGDLYPCHQFVGYEDYKIGNLFDKSFDMSLSKAFASMNVYSRNGCRDCWAKFYCSGGCSALNYSSNGDISQPDQTACKIERKRIECAIAIKAALILHKSYAQ